jgi:hypothetical protein
MRLLVLLLTMFVITSAQSEQLTFGFGNPAFSGNGYSSHVLSIEQLQYSRNEDIKADAKSAASAVERAEKNKTINKFIANVESRIYANLSKQLVDNMFGTNCTEDTSTSATECPDSGTAVVEGAQIAWAKNASGDTITLTVTDTDGSITTLTVPIGDFVF